MTQATVTQEGHSLHIKIPSKKNLFTILFLLLWLAGWCLGELSVIDKIVEHSIENSSVFLIVWLTVWTIAGIYSILSIFWLLAGHEHIKVVRAELILQNEIFGIGLSKKYNIREIRFLTFRVISELGFENRYTAKGGDLQFTYRSKNIYFGSGIGQEEAIKLIEILKRNSNFDAPNFK